MIDSTRPGGTSKFVLLIAVVGAISIGYVLLRDVLTLEGLAGQEARLRDFQLQYPVLSYIVAFTLYVIVTGLSLPGATVLTLVFGWFFGLVRGLLLVSFASTTGASLAFLLSRYLFRNSIQNRFGDRLAKFNEMFARDGSFYLFTLRLIPAVPFFVINAVMGLTPISALSFWWVSQLGMLPGTAVYVYAGASVPSLQLLAEQGIGAAFSAGQITRILTAFALLGIFPLCARWTLRYFSRGATPARVDTTDQSQSALGAKS
jgi:uncharacterized membrane protein YdjX (TVP38/TMEM64 family)